MMATKEAVMCGQKRKRNDDAESKARKLSLLRLTQRNEGVMRGKGKGKEEKSDEAKMLSKKLRYSRSILRIYMQLNKMNEEGSKALAKGTKRNFILQRIYCNERDGGRTFDDATFKILAENEAIYDEREQSPSNADNIRLESVILPDRLSINMSNLGNVIGGHKVFSTLIRFSSE